MPRAVIIGGSLFVYKRAAPRSAQYLLIPARRRRWVKDSKALLLDYLASIRDADRAASLFTDDGVFELAFLRPLGVGARYVGRQEITALLHQLLKLYPDIAFAPDDIQVLIETPENISGLVNHATWQVAIEQEQANKDWPGYGARR